VARFSTSIPTKKTFIELFSVTQQEGESTQVYLRRSNVEMLKVEELIEPIALEAFNKRSKRIMPSGEKFMFYQIEAYPISKGWM
jgi:hypothetical protein